MITILTTESNTPSLSEPRNNVVNFPTETNMTTKRKYVDRPVLADAGNYVLIDQGNGKDRDKKQRQKQEKRKLSNICKGNFSANDLDDFEDEYA